MEVWRRVDRSVIHEREVRTFRGRADGYTRVQLFLGNVDLETAETFERIADEIRWRIGILKREPGQEG